VVSGLANVTRKDASRGACDVVGAGGGPPTFVEQGALDLPSKPARFDGHPPLDLDGETEPAAVGRSFGLGGHGREFPG